MGVIKYKYMNKSRNDGIMVRTQDRYLGHFTKLCHAKQALAIHLKVRPDALPHRRQAIANVNSKKASKYVNVYRGKGDAWEVMVNSKKGQGLAYVGRFQSEAAAAKAAQQARGVRTPCVRKRSARETKRVGRDRFVFLKRCFKDSS